MNDKSYDEFDPVPPGELKLDGGIRRFVLILRSAGVETFESCEGGSGHSMPEPTIRFHGNAWEGFRAYAAARTHALPVYALRRVYDVNDGELQGPYWEIVFRCKDSVPDTL